MILKQMVAQNRFKVKGHYIRIASRGPAGSSGGVDCTYNELEGILGIDFVRRYGCQIISGPGGRLQLFIRELTRASGRTGFNV